MARSAIGPQEPQGGKLYRSLGELFAPFLREHAFECVSYKLDEKTFQYEIIEFLSHNIRLRLINDRDQYFADLALQEIGSNWFGVDDLLETLGVTEDDIGRGIKDMTVFAALLSTHFDAMLALLHPSKIAATREAIAAQKDARIARATGKSPRGAQTLH